MLVFIKKKNEMLVKLEYNKFIINFASQKVKKKKILNKKNYLIEQKI